METLKQETPVDELFGISNLFNASILYTLYRGRAEYAGCRYDGFLDQYQFLFRDPKNHCPALIALIKADRQNTKVPARSFQGALAKLSEDFRNAQRANGNRNGGRL
jgi:hypothetical protein